VSGKTATGSKRGQTLHFALATSAMPSAARARQRSDGRLSRPTHFMPQMLCGLRVLLALRPPGRVVCFATPRPRICDIKWGWALPAAVRSPRRSPSWLPLRRSAPGPRSRLGRQISGAHAFWPPLPFAVRCWLRVRCGFEAARLGVAGLFPSGSSGRHRGSRASGTLAMPLGGRRGQCSGCSAARCAAGRPVPPNPTKPTPLRLRCAALRAARLTLSFALLPPSPGATPFYQ
jgi:hypothetical protein